VSPAQAQERQAGRSAPAAFVEAIAERVAVKLGERSPSDPAPRSSGKLAVSVAEAADLIA
jgi:hypothetical protein